MALVAPRKSRFLANGNLKFFEIFRILGHFCSFLVILSDFDPKYWLLAIPRGIFGDLEWNSGRRVEIWIFDFQDVWKCKIELCHWFPGFPVLGWFECSFQAHTTRPTDRFLTTSGVLGIYRFHLCDVRSHSFVFPPMWDTPGARRCGDWPNNGTSWRPNGPFRQEGVHFYMTTSITLHGHNSWLAHGFSMTPGSLGSCTVRALFVHGQKTSYIYHYVT